MMAFTEVYMVPKYLKAKVSDLFSYQELSAIQLLISLHLYLYIKSRYKYCYFLINYLHVRHSTYVVKGQKVSFNLKIFPSIIYHAYVNHTSQLYHSPISLRDLEKDLS